MGEAVKKKAQRQLVSTDTIDGSRIVYVWYLSGITQSRFARELAKYAGHLFGNILPVVIITYDRVPPIWACPMVQGFCTNTPMISIESRDGKKNSCTIVAADDRRLIGEIIPNPDPNPAWGPPMQTSHAAVRH